MGLVLGSQPSRLPDCRVRSLILSFTPSGSQLVRERTSGSERCGEDREVAGEDTPKKSGAEGAAGPGPLSSEGHFWRILRGDSYLGGLASRMHDSEHYS